MHKNTKILLTIALLLIALTAVILYNSSTVFLQLFIACKTEVIVRVKIDQAVHYFQRTKIVFVLALLKL